MNWLKNSWKMVATIIGALAIMTTLTTFYSNLATSDDVAKAKAEVKAENSAAIQELRKSIQLNEDINRLDRINDNIIKAKIQLRQYPKDKDIKDDIKNLIQEKVKVKEKIENRK
jgi:preprotein translocase subunit SecF